MKCGMVILNYNDYTTTINLLENIKEYDSIDTIVVVDNCSTNDSYKKLKELNYEKCEVIKSEKNGGYAYGNNFGVKHLINKFDVEYIIIANPDVIFDENYVLKALNLFKNDKSVSIVSSVVLDANQNVTKSFWKRPTYFNDLLECSIIFRLIINFCKKNKIDFSKEVNYVDVVLGSLFVVKVDDFKKVCFFDEGTFLFYEENILSKKINTINKKCALMTDISYIHDHSTTISQTFKSVKVRKIHLQSKKYYQIEVNRIGWIRKMLLKLATTYSIFETFITTPLKNLFKKIFRRNI